MTRTPSKARRRLARGALALLALSALAIAATVTGCASFGGRPEGDRLARMQRSPEWRDDRFVNPEPMWTDMTSAWRRVFQSSPGGVPEAPVPVVASDGRALKALPASGLRITWFGHSSTLLEIDGTRLLTDPIWSERPTPVPGLGPKRFFAPPIALADLPPVDAVLVSHDHYDHLDRPTIEALNASTKAVFIVPLGIGAHLARWGVAESRIAELDWWQATTVGALEVTATPSRHASGRIDPHGDRTLWSGFALAGPAHRVFYSGDTGLASSMREVGQRLGPFDLALVEAGQYDADWPDWHLGPEQAVEVATMVRAKRVMPVHWALFKLAHHTWTEPVERVLAAASCRDLPVLAPKPGQSVELDAPLERWWPRTPWRSATERPIVATKAGDRAQRFDVFHCEARA